MRRFVWGVGCGIVVWAWLGACGLSAAVGQAPKDGGEGPAPAAGSEESALVEKLGDPSYEIRRRAAEMLRDLGLKARDALAAGLEHADPEVRRRCRWILEDVFEADFQRRLQAFVADKQGKGDHDLPGWERYRRTIGDDAAARDLYVQMLKRESGLLVSASSGPAAAVESVDLRLRQVYQMMTRRNSRQRKPPEMETVAALLFIVGDEGLKLPQELADNTYLSSVIQQASFRQALSEGKHQKPARKLVGCWLVRPTGPRLAHVKLQLAMQYRIEEGVWLALSMIKQKNPLGGHVQAYAVSVLGQLGGKPYASVLAELLKDETECYRRVVNSKTYATEIRDVALAWLVHLTGQSLKDYGLEQAADAFKQLSQNPRSSFNLHNVGFGEDGGREKALKRWQEWVKDHPLPEPPKRPEDAPSPLVMAPLAAPPPAESAGSEPPRRAELAIADRIQMRSLEMARELARQERYGEAVKRLGEVLAADQDYTIRPEPDVPLRRCLKPEAERLLGSLPQEALADYELLFRRDAEPLLNRALARGDTPTMELVAERYFYTRAGAQATLLLALGNLDRGHWQRAALYLKRLQDRSPYAEDFEPTLSLTLATCLVRSANPEAAREVLLRMKDRQPAGTVEIGGRQHELFTRPDEALGWLESLVGSMPPGGAELGWLVYRGEPGRNATSPPGGPYLKAEPLCRPDDELLARLFEQLRKEQVDEHRVALPKLHPLVVGETTVVRTATHLRAIDSKSGKLLWESPLEDSLRHYVRQQQRWGKPDEAQTEYFSEGLSRRFWQDATFGRLSSDGRRVFGVEGLSFHFSPEFQRLLVMPDGTRRLDPDLLKRHNLLVAYDLRTGKVLWEVGGPPDAAGVKLPGTFFLGPPLPLGGRLYCAAQVERETRLVELDAETGEPLWDLVLPIEEDLPELPRPGLWPNNGSPDDVSQTAGISPSYADGILVCQTAEDHVVALDLATRTVLWIYQSFRPEPSRRRRAIAIWQLQVGKPLEPDPTEQWADNSVTIAEGRVLITPAHSDELICLDLADGRREWSVGRRDGLFVAGVQSGKVVIVGHGSVWAVRLADGEPAWPAAVELPPGALPAGRGYLSPEHLHLPLSTAEVASIDLDEGRLVSRALSPDGIIPGNLVRCGDAVFSQNLEGVWRFETLSDRDARLADVLRSRPDDAAALADRGEVLLHGGRLIEAVEHLRAALKQKPTERVRSLLVDALIEGLRTDFLRFEPLSEELRTHLEQSNEKARFLQHLADALARQGQHEAALHTYLELIELEPEEHELAHYGAAWVARRDRWIAGQLAALWKDASEGQRAEIARYVAERLETNRHASLLAYFGSLPASQAVRLRLAQEGLRQKKWLEAEQRLEIVLARGRPEEQREAIARLAALMQSRQRHHEAANLYRELSGPLADAVCLEGKTGARLVEALPAKGPVRRLLDDAERWPGTKVEKEVVEKKGQIIPRFPMNVPGDGGRFGVPTTVEFDSQQRKLIGSDPMGRMIWEVALSEQVRHVHHGMFRTGVPVRRHGHLLVAHLGAHVCAVDTLADKGKLLWSRDTFSSDPQLQIRLGLMGIMRVGGNVPTMPGSLPMMVAVAPECVSFQHDRELLGVEPLSGETLWSRSDLPLGCDLFGDDDVLLVTPPQADEAVVLSPRDGRQITRCAVPPLSERLWTCGRRVVTWKSEAKAARLAMLDPVAQQTVWEREFPAGSKPWLVEGDEVAVADQDGKLVVLALPDGRPVIEAEVDPTESLEGIVVLRSARRYVVMVNRPGPAPGGAVIVHNYPGHVQVNGRAYGFDRQTGKRLWATDLEHQSMRVDQPAEVPVLTFFGRVAQRQGKSYRTVTRILCLDRRNGKVLHQEKSDKNHSNFYELHADPDQGRLEIRTYTQTIRFRFS